MKTTRVRSSVPLFALLAFAACASTPTPLPAANVQAPPSNDYGGTFKNSGGGVLTVTDFNYGGSFTFELTITSDDACNGVSYSREAMFEKSGDAKSDVGDLFKFKGGSIHLEPATSAIGMDCARVIDVDFQRDK